jgi:hypothetical protein
MLTLTGIVIILCGSHALAETLLVKIGNRYLRAFVSLVAMLLIGYLVIQIWSAVAISSIESIEEAAQAGMFRGNLTGTLVTSFFGAFVLRMIWAFMHPQKNSD